MADLFSSRERFLAPSQRRGACLITVALFFLLTEVGREICRPFIYQNPIQDVRFGDAIGNLPGTIAHMFFELGVARATRAQGFRLRLRSPNWNSPSCLEASRTGRT